MGCSDFGRIGVPGVQMQMKINETTTVLEKVPMDSDRKLAELIDGEVGFQYELILTEQGAQLLPNGSWTGVLKALQREEVDMIVGRMTLTSERNEAFDFSYTFACSEITFMTRKPEYEADASAIIRPFSTQMSLTAIICLSTMPALFRTLLRKNLSAMTQIMSTVSSSVNQGMQYQPNCVREYFLLASWFLGIGLVGYFYSAVLLSFLTCPSLSGIKTVQELADGITDGKYFAATVSGGFFSSFLIKSNDESLAIVGRSSKQNDKGDQFVRLLKDRSYEKKLAYVLSKVDAVPPPHTHTFEDFYFISDNRFGFFYSAFPMSMDFCWKEKLNDVIHHFWSAGVFEKFLSNVKYKTFLNDTKHVSPPKERHESEIVLTLSDLKVALLFTFSYSIALFGSYRASN